MKELSSKYRLKSENFTGLESKHADTYRRLIDMGHGLRPNAGTLINALNKIAERKVIDEEAVDAIIDAVDHELEGTGLGVEAMRPEVETFYQAFAYKFTDKSKVHLDSYFDADFAVATPIDAAKQVPNTPTLNGWFHAIAEDGVVDKNEAQQLIGAQKRLRNGDFDRLLATLVGAGKVRFAKGTLTEIRAGIQDPTWIQRAHLAHSMKKKFGGTKKVGVKVVREFIAELDEHISPKPTRTKANTAFNAAQKLADLPNVDALPLTDAAFDELQDYLEGTPVIVRLLEELGAGFNADKLAEFAEAVLWTHGKGKEPEGGGLADKLEEALGEPYATHPEIGADLCYDLDVAVRAEQLANRRRVVNVCDLLGALDLVLEDRLNGELEVQDPRNDTGVLDVSSTHEGIQIENYHPDFDIFIGPGYGTLITKITEDDQVDCTREEMIAFLEDADLADVVRTFLHHYVE